MNGRTSKQQTTKAPPARAATVVAALMGKDWVRQPTVGERPGTGGPGPDRM